MYHNTLYMKVGSGVGRTKNLKERVVPMPTACKSTTILFHVMIGRFFVPTFQRFCCKIVLGYFAFPPSRGKRFVHFFVCVHHAARFRMSRCPGNTFVIAFADS